MFSGTDFFSNEKFMKNHEQLKKRNDHKKITFEEKKIVLYFPAVKIRLFHYLKTLSKTVPISEIQ